MAERFKVRVCGRSLAGIAGSNPAGAWMFVLYSKDKRHKPGESGQRRMDKERRQNKNISTRLLGSLTQSFRPSYEPGVHPPSKRNEYLGYVRRDDNLTTFKCRLPKILGASTSRTRMGLPRDSFTFLYILINYSVPFSSNQYVKSDIKNTTLYKKNN